MYKPPCYPHLSSSITSECVTLLRALVGLYHFDLNPADTNLEAVADMSWTTEAQGRQHGLYEATNLTSCPIPAWELSKLRWVHSFWDAAVGKMPLAV